jgi:hypothetical protein
MLLKVWNDGYRRGLFIETIGNDVVSKLKVRLVSEVCERDEKSILCMDGEDHGWISCWFRGF